MDLAHLLWLLLLSAIWGASYMLIKIGVAAIEPLTFAMLRVLCGTLTLLGIALARRQALPRAARDWRRFAFVGVFNILVPFGAISWGTQHIPSGVAAILNATMPLFVFILAVSSGTEALSWVRLGGLLVGFGGIVVLTLPRLEGGLNLGLLGSLAIVGAALSYAVATVYARRHLTGYPPLVASLGQIGTGWLFLLVASCLFERPWAQPLTAGPVAAAAFLGAVGTAVAYLIYYRLVAAVGATKTSVTTYIVPLFGVLWGRVILAERLSWHAFAALGMILVGLVLANDLLGLAAGSGAGLDRIHKIHRIEEEVRRIGS